MHARIVELWVSLDHMNSKQSIVDAENVTSSQRTSQAKTSVLSQGSDIRKRMGLQSADIPILLYNKAQHRIGDGKKMGTTSSQPWLVVISWSKFPLQVQNTR